MRKRNLFLLLLPFVLVSCSNKTETKTDDLIDVDDGSKDDQVNVIEKENTEYEYEVARYNLYKDDVKALVNDVLGGNIIPYVSAKKHVASELTQNETRFLKVSAFDLAKGEEETIENYSKSCVNLNFEIEGYDEDYNSYFAYKKIESNVTFYLQYNYLEDKLQGDHFDVYAYLVETTSNYVYSWPSDVVSSYTSENVPVFTADYYEALSGYTVDNYVELNIYCYKNDGIKSSDFTSYESTLLSNEFALTQEVDTYFKRYQNKSKNLQISIYFSDYSTDNFLLIKVLNI